VLQKQNRKDRLQMIKKEGEGRCGKNQKLRIRKIDGRRGGPRLPRNESTSAPHRLPLRAHKGRRKGIWAEKRSDPKKAIQRSMGKRGQGCVKWFTTYRRGGRD